MSLLREIQIDAINSNAKISDLLRKCQILAYRLGNEDFKNWISFELQGYPQDPKNVPDYRILNVNSKGHFAGAFGSALNNADMLTYSLPEQLQKSLSKAYFFSPIATLESLTNDESEVLTQDWNPAIIAHYGSKMYEGYNCMQAWKVIPASAVVGIIDTVKTKILNFALEIELLNPQAGEAALNSNPIPQEKVTQIFNFNIAGNVQNLASGNHHSTIHQEINNSQIPEEFLNLLSTLRKSEIEEELVSDLELRIEKLGTSIGTPEYTSQYGELMSFLSNHVTIYTFLAPFIPMLSSYLS